MRETDQDMRVRPLHIGLDDGIVVVRLTAGLEILRSVHIERDGGCSIPDAETSIERGFRVGTFPAHLTLGSDHGVVRGGGIVVPFDERVSFLEGRVAEHSKMVNSIRDVLVSFEQRMDRRFEMVDQRFTGLELKLDQRFATMEQKMDQRFGALDQKFTRYFLWLVGIVITAMAAMIVKAVH